jgi:uncharacterized repeat protein (TIGR03943 family)
MTYLPRWLAPWLDILAIAAWGILFLKYWATGKLYLLIHPNYFWLTVAAGITLIGVAIWRAMGLLRARRQPKRGSSVQASHVTLFPPGLSSALLLITAILGFLISPRAFASQTAIDRGITDANTVTRVKPQAFRATVSSEEKTLVDWIRTLTVYPEPDAYMGQPAKVQGFVVHPASLPSNYLLISRFVLTCCAADAYPISLPVKLAQSRDAYKPDSWQEISGQMITETLDGKRQLVIEAKTVRAIDEPKNPYDY